MGDLEALFATSQERAREMAVQKNSSESAHMSHGVVLTVASRCVCLLERVHGHDRLDELDLVRLRELLVVEQARELGLGLDEV